MWKISSKVYQYYLQTIFYMFQIFKVVRDLMYTKMHIKNNLLPISYVIAIILTYSTFIILMLHKEIKRGKKSILEGQCTVCFKG